MRWRERRAGFGVVFVCALTVATLVRWLSVRIGLDEPLGGALFVASLVVGGGVLAFLDDGRPSNS